MIRVILSLCDISRSRDPVVSKNHIEVRSRHSYFAALRHDVLKRFKGSSLYKVPHYIVGRYIPTFIFCRKLRGTFG